jgi:hypothetical protein
MMVKDRKWDDFNILEMMMVLIIIERSKGLP